MNILTKVTGQFDRSKFGLSSSDPGGQIDRSVRKLSNCYGYKYYVQLIEPNIEEMGRHGQIASVESANDFCFFLPPERGSDIAANEDRAVAFCTAPLADAPGAQIFPQDFIQTANFKANKTRQWVQVTGRISNSAYGLSRLIKADSTTTSRR
ncbi:MAG: hypothetical protein J3Q66DRAFT_389290 [Benniella sp.]|nr:MAG: hypothetical protein J3Q66DRAFT_389290 [Benniella sp.]